MPEGGLPRRCLSAPGQEETPRSDKTRDPARLTSVISVLVAMYFYVFFLVQSFIFVGTIIYLCWYNHFSLLVKSFLIVGKIVSHCW